MLAFCFSFILYNEYAFVALDIFNIIMTILSLQRHNNYVMFTISIINVMQYKKLSKLIMWVTRTLNYWHANEGSYYYKMIDRLGHSCTQIIIIGKKG